MKLIQFILKSMARRRKQIIRVSLAVFFSFIFITGILLFQENMYRWQMASSKEHFGDWFVMRVQKEIDEAPAVKEHPYLEKGATALTGSSLYDDLWTKTNYCIGSMSDDFIRQGNITIEQGRMPKNNDEIALDWSTLLKLNVNPEIGSKVTIHTYHGADANENNRVEKEYTLVGIMTSYTNMWQGGVNVPGAVVTSEELRNTVEGLTNAVTETYIYPLKSFVKTKDYEKIFTEMKEQYHLNMTYNSSVYNYEPWESSLVYNYMYLLTMLIGIVAITYQVIGYQRSRQEILNQLKRLGATRSQLYLVTFIENVVIVLISGLLGFLVAVIVGKGICGGIEAKKGVSFYVLGTGVCLKVLLSMLTAVAVEELTGILMAQKRKYYTSAKKTKVISVRRKLKAGNYIRETHKRMIRGNGIFQNLLIRLFSATMTVIMLVCVVNIYSAFRAYKANNDETDFVGFMKEDAQVSYEVNYILDYELFQESMKHEALEIYDMMNQDAAADKSVEEWKSLLWNGMLEGRSGSWYDTKAYQLMSYSMNRGGIKTGNTSLSSGVNDSLLQDIINIPGVEDIQYSYFETERNWKWDSMDYDQMGLRRYYSKSNQQYTGKTSKYLYATEYVEPTREKYDLISSYLDPSQIDYDAFVRGEQVLVVEDVNGEGKYDDSMNAGVTLKQMNYKNPFYDASNAGADDYSTYGTKLYTYVKRNMLNDSVNDVNFTRDGEHRYFLGLYAYRFLTRHVSDEEIKRFWTEDYMDEESLESNLSNYGYEETYDNMRRHYATMLEGLSNYKQLFTPAATTKVAGVVHLSDEVKEALKDYVGEYGQYTAIASKNLGQQALDNQNALLSDMFQFENGELPEEITLKMEPNQLAIRYDLTSTFASTNNVVCSYLGQAGFTYTSYSAEKDLLKAKTNETMILYGITLLAAIVTNILVGILLIKNRLDRRRGRLQILQRTGAQQSTMISICMLESLRESIWCLPIAPIVLLIHWMIYWRYMRKM